MPKSFIPLSITGRLLLIISFVASAAVYLLRFAANDMILDNATGMLCIPFACIIGVSSISYFIGTIIYTFKVDGHPMPMIVLILGIVLAVLLPTPPKYEIRLFDSRRADYEYIVTLARDHQLDHSQRCDIERTYEPPEGYSELSNECILVDYQPYFSIEFSPRIYVEKIVYIEDPSQIEDVMGCNNSDMHDYYQQLDENWFYCSMSP